MIKIITDAGSDFSCDNDIYQVALSYYFDDNKEVEYGDLNNLSNTEFYNYMRMGRVPRTASVNVNSALCCFEKELASGNDVICIGLSSGISSCYSNELLASNFLKDKYPDRRIEIIDSVMGSLGQAMMVEHACDMVDLGYSIDDIVKYINDNKMFYNCEIVLEDLIYPVRGGRVNSVIGSVSSKMNIRPLIRVDSKGKTVLGTTVRGNKKINDKLIDRMFMDCSMDISDLGIIHGDNIDKANELRDRLLGLGIVQDVSIAEIGPVIGSYSGPGSIGVVYKKKVKRKQMLNFSFFFYKNNILIVK